MMKEKDGHGRLYHIICFYLFVRIFTCVYMLILGLVKSSKG